jgi:hypothetical protein
VLLAAGGATVGVFPGAIDFADPAIADALDKVRPADR